MTRALGSADRQHARLRLRIGRHADLKIEADVSRTGMMAAAALVSGLLLSTAVLVRIARDGRQA